MPFFRARFPGPSHSSLLPNPPHQFSLLAQTTLQNGHSQRLIRPNREAQRGPFARSFGPDDRPFWELGDRWRLRNQKRGALAYSSCQCKDIQKNGQMQIGNKKHWQPPHPISNRTNLPLPAEMRELPLRAQCHSFSRLRKSYTFRQTFYGINRHKKSTSQNIFRKRRKNIW